jgi:hypothetical protein
MVSPWVGLNIFIEPSVKKFAETRPASTNFISIPFALSSWCFTQAINKKNIEIYRTVNDF